MVVSIKSRKTLISKFNPLQTTNEFKRLNQFHNKDSKKTRDILSDDGPKVMKTYKPWSLKNTIFFQYTLV